MAQTAVRVECGKSRGEAPSPPPEAACLTSLDHSETSEHPLARQNRCQYALHRRNEPERKAVVDALWESEDPGHQKRAHRLGWCGFSARVFVASDGGAGLYPDRCRDRLCPTCATDRARRLRDRAESVIAAADSVRFVTLTLQHNGDPLKTRIQHLRDAWKKLRRGGWWRKRVTGGMYGIEVKQNPTSRHWHVHLHCLVEGDYLDQRTLSREWSVASGGSCVVDVRAVHSRKAAVKYIASYVTKGSSVDGWEGEAIREFADALRGQRLLQTFGSLHGIPVDVNETEEEPEEAVAVLDLWAVAMYAESGDVSACHLVVALAALDERVERLIDEMLPAFEWGRYGLLCDPLDFIRAWAADPPPEHPHRRPIAVQLHLWI